MNRNAINRTAIGRSAIGRTAIGRSALLRRNARSPLIACIALALLAALACGRYGPPRRVENLPAAAPAAVPADGAVPAAAVPADQAVPADETSPSDETDPQPVEPHPEP
jgi:hypothetical protein